MTNNKTDILTNEILQKNVLNLNDLALYTGFSKSFIYKLTSGRKIPFYRPSGKLLFFKRDEIDQWLLHKSVPTISNVQENHLDYLK